MSRWGEAVWDYDRWPALAVADMLQQPPDTARGVPTGLGDWKVSVEILLPADALSLWGIGRWGEVEWTTLAWQDLTPWVRGAEWQRGSDEPYGRPRIGTLRLSLDSNEDRFSPWNPNPSIGGVSYFAPGTIIRVGVRSATDMRGGRDGWLPQITCIVDQWGMVYADPTGADRYVDVTAVETLRDLSQIDDNALPGVVGGGEGAFARFERLLAASDWKYGLLIEHQGIILDPANYPMQSTDMAANRIAECYQTADSADAVFRSDRTGAALVTNPEYIGTVGPADPRLVPLVEFSQRPDGLPRIGFFPVAAQVADLRYVPYTVDTFKSSPDDHNIVNDARFAAVGGSQQFYEQPASISRHGRRTLVRNDFIGTTPDAPYTIAKYTTIRRGLNVLRVTALTIETSDRGTENGLCALAADLYNSAAIYPPTTELAPDADHPYILAFISNMTHRFTPRNGAAVTWQTTFGFDTRVVNNIPGAQLPANPL